MYIISIVLIVFAVFIDQYSKKKADTKLKGRMDLPIRLGPFLFTYIRNPGAALGFLSKYRKLLLVVTAMMVFCVFVLLFESLFVTYQMTESIALSMILGGAIGNGMDRVRKKYVIDFISFSIPKIPVFNIADFFILIGSALYIITSQFSF